MDLSPASQRGEPGVKGSGFDLRKNAVDPAASSAAAIAGVAQAIGRGCRAQRVVEGDREEGRQDDRLGQGAVQPLQTETGRKRLSAASSAAKSRSTEARSAEGGRRRRRLATHGPMSTRTTVPIMRI